MAHVIAVINQKGGVGKTTTTCNLAYSFAQKKKRTLLIDLEASANATDIFLPSLPFFTIKDFILNESVGREAVLNATLNGLLIEGLSIIPSHIKVALAPREISTRHFKETLLQKKIQSAGLFDHFEYIFIDCPPTLTDLTVLGMYAANFILIPLRYEKYALEGISDLFNILKEVKEKQDYEFKILRNGFDARKKTVNSYINEKLESFIQNRDVFDTVIRQDEEINKATIEGELVLTFAPRSFGAQDFLKLSNELEEMLQNG